jgi:excinuclease ABC subunit C
MKAAAVDLKFEEAARLRDLVYSIQDSVERQRVVDPKLGNRDLWGLYREGSRGVLAIVPVRDGAMGEPRASVLSALVGPDEDVLSSLINQAYPENAPIPAEIVLPVLPPDHEALAEVLTERQGRKVVLHAPQRGDKLRLVSLATENARVRWLAETDEAERHRNAMAALAEVLQLSEVPHRMECFDNSHIGGDDPVAAMAVFIDGKPDRQHYRRYRIKEAMGGDDYAGMREVLTRRFKRGLQEGLLPDLLVVDGGKGQLGVAMAVLEDLGVHGLAVCGIAKPRTEHAKGQRHATDKIVLPNLKNPLRLRRGHPGLRILQYLRDETHKHAIRYQRKVRSKHSLVSVLEAIPGVGPSRKKALLKALGSAEGVALASPNALAAVDGIGPALAEQIWTLFHPNQPPSGSDP